MNAYSLWPHQIQAEPLLTSGSAILYHEMRLGKTRSALHAYNQLLNEGVVQDLVVITVAGAKATWEQEVGEMGLSIPTYTAYGQQNQDMVPLFPASFDAAGVLPRIYIVNWEILPHWQRFLYNATHGAKRKFCLALDEGHLNLRNPHNKRYKAAYWLRGFAERVWELTGTLYVKSGLDVYYQLRFMGKENPYRWMDAEDFGKEFCNRRFNPYVGTKGAFEYTGLKNERDLMARIPAISVLKMDDVADMPLPVQLPCWVSNKNHQWEFYRNETTLAQEIADLVEEKAMLTAQYVQDMPERPVVVFGWNVAFTERVAELLEAPRIFGGTSLADRERLRKDFQSGRTSVLVGNLRSLGLGVSLDRADHFVYGEPYWDASLYLQAQARGRSFGKQRRLTHHHILVAGSVDEYTWKVRLERGKAIDRLVEAARDAETAQ